MTDKAKHHKPHAGATHPSQAHLPHIPAPAEAAIDLSARIDKLVSLTFDSDPMVRRQAATELSTIDDPRALFALLELSADRDEETRNLARSGLNNFKEEKEAVVDLEKIFEAKSEGKPPPAPEEMEATKKKLMPSIERLFSKKPGSKEKLMPSIEKLFSWMPGQKKPEAQSAAQAQSGGRDAHIPGAVPAEQNAPSVQEKHEDSTDEGEISSPAKDDDEEWPEKEPDERVYERDSSLDSLSEVPKHHASQFERAEAALGVFPERSSPNMIRQARHSDSKVPSKEALHEATNFPVPDSLKDKISSPMLAIPSLVEGEEEQAMEDSDDIALKAPPTRIDYYKWAYALAITPGVKTSDLKKEKERMFKQAKDEIEAAFKLAIDRVKTNGIESLTGLKPGMKKITTFPLEVMEHSKVMVPISKRKADEMSRIVLSDGKRSVPLYVDPARTEGIRVGDLISLRDAHVDFYVHSNEVVFLLGKNGQMIVTK